LGRVAIPATSKPKMFWPSLHVVGQLSMTAAHKLDRIALRRAVTAEEQSSIGTS